MKESMKYMTVKERELYEKLAEKYNIKGCSLPASLMSHQPYPKIKNSSKRKSRGKKQ